MHVMGAGQVGARLGALASLAVLVALGCAGCSAPPPAARGTARAPASARSLVVVTIDTMRADHVGAYGYARARTPAFDRLARDGARFDRAWAPAPITLTSHASLFTGRYPAGHLARDNGMIVDPRVPTLAAVLHDHGFATAAFVAAYPLDHRFGLSRGFETYGDRMPRGSDGRLANERPARQVVDEAIAWLAGHRGTRTFLWVHLFEPHAPYGDPEKTPGRPPVDRYDDEIATADAETGRLLEALGADREYTLVVLASDHGEAFGEHGEVGHSLFVYDTTLRVALLMAGPGVPAGRRVADPVCLIDVAPTVLGLLGVPAFDADGIDLRPALAGRRLPQREIYAESFAPLVEFGWSPLRALRSGRWKAVAAPRPELYDLDDDPAETRDMSGGAQAAAAGSELSTLLARIDRYSAPDLPKAGDRARGVGADARARLGALGYVQGGRSPANRRVDPKDRRELAARIATVASGEVRGDALLAALGAIVADDGGNGQMQLRLGDALAERRQYRDAAPHFAAAIAAGVPSADPYIGLALCKARLGDAPGALATLRRSEAVEPGNPVVDANIGLLEAGLGHTDAAVAALERALAVDPGFDEARFNLAIVCARAGRRARALAAAEDLLRRLSPSSPQRGEVERLVQTLASPEAGRLP